MSWHPVRHEHYEIWTKKADYGVIFSATFCIDVNPHDPTTDSCVVWRPIVRANGEIRTFVTFGEAEKAVVDYLSKNPAEWHNPWRVSRSEVVRSRLGL